MAGVQLEHVVREYTMGRTTIRAVDDISFTIPEGKYKMCIRDRSFWGRFGMPGSRYG